MQEALWTVIMQWFGTYCKLHGETIIDVIAAAKAGYEAHVVFMSNLRVLACAMHEAAKIPTVLAHLQPQQLNTVLPHACSAEWLPFDPDHIWWWTCGQATLDATASSYDFTGARASSSPCAGRCAICRSCSISLYVLDEVDNT